MNITHEFHMMAFRHPTCYVSHIFTHGLFTHSACVCYIFCTVNFIFTCKTWFYSSHIIHILLRLNKLMYAISRPAENMLKCTFTCFSTHENTLSPTFSLTLSYLSTISMSMPKNIAFRNLKTFWQGTPEEPFSLRGFCDCSGYTGQLVRQVVQVLKMETGVRKRAMKHRHIGHQTY